MSATETVPIENDAAGAHSLHRLVRPPFEPADCVCCGEPQQTGRYAGLPCCFPCYETGLLREWLEQYNALETQDAQRPNVESFTENTSVTIKESDKEWTTQMDNRFENLAILEATGKISAEETSELELLTHDRRNLKYPRSSDEVLWEYHQRQATENLVKAVRDYARLHSVADTKRSRS